MSYGINIDTLERLVGKPDSDVLIENEAFRLEKRILQKGGSCTVGGGDLEATLWIEEGNARIGEKALKQHESITLPPEKNQTLSADSDAVAYLFYGPAQKKAEYMEIRPSFDKRDKYWGTIESIASSDYAGKRMLVKKGTHASLEYHCKKIEAYYVHSGKLLLRFRAGRGEDRFFELRAGETAFIPPGLMHQRGGLEDTVIIEISTSDDDSDSFLVEDGQKIPMPKL